MSRTDRTGKRIPRSRRSQNRIPELGYYLIVTDTVGTEPSYFLGLKGDLPEEIQAKLIIKVFSSKTEKMIQECKELALKNPQYCIPCIVFDRDRVVDFNEIIEEATKEDIIVGWSNPCFEIWLFAYFGSIPSITTSKTCCQKFSEKFKRATGQEYVKSDQDIYLKLIQYGDEKTAIAKMEQRHLQNKRDGYNKPSDMCPCSTVYQLIREIKDKTYNYISKNT